MNREELTAGSAGERTWQQTIDRLVDGELSDAESRELLAMLDGVDGGWRRLALAYVEAQWLRGEFPLLVHTGPASSEEPALSRVAQAGKLSRENRYSRWAFMTLAIAASMVLAFGLSLWWRDAGIAPHGRPTAPVANVPQSNDGGTKVATQQDRGPAVAVVPAGDPPLAVASPKSPQEPQLVVIGSGGDLQEQQSATVPPQVIDALQRMGHRVDQRRGIMPVRLKDGRNVDIPYDQLDVQYRGASSFQ